ncbi:MAG: nuclear transport factor 2 family protein [Pseudomonadota bacterium]|jgi:hypothetical protein|uniref:nuclear transport factor 2 family protein n=1 Tax=Burkholderiaceae TaxID=119060 RepID=UPI0010F99F81|nr:nuclear transport factor 2 family protein [Burkholderia sp. 4M9327F10]
MNEFTGNEREASMLEIIDLLHQYAWSLDGGDGAGLKDVFNESATASVRVAGKAASAEPWQGRETIASALTRKRDANPLWSSHQLTTPLFVALEHDRATVKTYLSLFSCERGETPEIAATGEYRAQVSRVSGSWKIDQLELTLDSEV